MDQKDKQTETNNLNTTQNQTKQELYVDDCPKIVYNFNTNGLSKVIAKKVENLVQILNNEVINLPRLKERLAEGIPDEANLIRQYSWKLALGYLPPQKSKWQQTIRKQEATYRGLVQHFLPSSKFQDYPLIVKKGYPRFQQLQADFLLWEQIQKDTSRTHSQFTFFSTETHQMMLPYLTSARRQKFKLINGQNEEQYKKFLNDKQKQRKTYRYDYMSRILYIYSRLNPRIQYVQGMNQILAPIFYLLNASKPKNYIDEAACFYLFNNVISDIIDVHIKDLDKSQNGVYGRLNEVNQILVVIEPLIWNRLQKLKIDPFFYSFRWVTLLYAQDFELFDIMRIWESIFAVEERIKYINFIAIAIIITCKEIILNNGFAVVLEHLQNIKENTDINQVIKIATQLYLEYKDKDFNSHAKKNKKALKEGENEAKKEQERTRQGKEGNLFKRVSNFLGKYLE